MFKDGNSKEHIRHIDKTRQDRMPVSERQRVKDWQKRIAAMRNPESAKALAILNEQEN